MAAGLFYVYTDPGSVDEAEFHDWYDHEHGPARLRVPGIRGALRYRALDDLKPPWLALYDLDSPEVIDSAEYKALGGTSGLGENIAGGAPTQTVANAVGVWIAEQASYDHATNACTGGKDCGHYTQIVWSTTTGVGCAQESCTTGSPFGAYAGSQWDFEVCDFSPPGNITGQLPY